MLIELLILVELEVLMLSDWLEETDVLNELLADADADELKLIDALLLADTEVERLPDELEEFDVELERELEYEVLYATNVPKLLKEEPLALEGTKV